MSTIQEQLDQALNNVPLVYAAGKKAGHDTAWDNFWEGFQDSGNRKNYMNAFALWYNIEIKPKYPIIITGTTTLNTFWGADIYSFKDNGIVLDISAATGLQQTFQGASSTINGVTTRHGPVHIDIPITVPETVTNLSQTFAWTNVMKSITDLYVHENCNFTNTFNGNTTLEILIFREGSVIGKSISLASSSKLTAESAISVISHLKNLVEAGTQGSATVTFHANVWTLLDADTSYPEGETSWRTYITNTLGWNLA